MKTQLSELFGKTIHCSACGCSHFDPLKEAHIYAGAYHELPGMISRGGYKKPLITSDTNTEEVLGRKVKNELKKAGVAFSEHVYCEDRLI